MGIWNTESSTPFSDTVAAVNGTRPAPTPGPSVWNVASRTPFADVVNTMSRPIVPAATQRNVVRTPQRNVVRTPQDAINRNNAYINAQLQKARELDRQAAQEQQAAMNNQIEELRRQQQQAVKLQKQQIAADKARMAKQRDSVFKAMSQRFEGYGMDGNEILSALKKVPGGLEGNEDVITMAIRDTNTWKDRFGTIMETRRKNGLPAISEQEVLSTESAYRQVLDYYKLPKGFYDSYKDFQSWIAKDVSPDEIRERAGLVDQHLNNTDPTFIKAFKKFYGISKGDLAAYMLDRSRGVELLRQREQAAVIGGEGLGQGLDSVNRKFSEKLVDKDIGRQEARQAFNRVAMEEKDMKVLAARDGETLTEKGMIRAELGLAPGVQKKMDKLKSRERARFGGSSGGTTVFGNTDSGSF